MQKMPRDNKLRDMEASKSGSNPFFGKNNESKNSKKPRKPINKPKDQVAHTVQELLNIFRMKKSKIHSIIETTLRNGETDGNRKPKKQELLKAARQVSKHAADSETMIIRTTAKANELSENEQLNIYIIKDDLSRLTLEIKAFREIVNSWIASEKAGKKAPAVKKSKQIDLITIDNSTMPVENMPVENMPVITQ